MTSSLREHWNLDEGVAFLNHGSFGATPRAVLAAQARLRDQMEQEPVAFFERYLPGAMDAARTHVARWVGADPAGFAFVPNASTGVATVLANLKLAPDDELLVTDHAYNACRNALLMTAQRSGAEVVTAKIPFPGTTADGIVEAILAAVSERTRFALIDHVTSSTGLVFPLERIVSGLAARGVDVLIDGAHAPGMVAVGVDALAAMGATYYTANGHKWPCAAKGAAFLWVREDRREGFNPLVISHGYNGPLRTGETRFRAQFDWVGTDDPTAFLTWPDAIDDVAELVAGGWSAIRERNRAMALAARGRVCEALKIAAPAEDALIGSLVSVPLPETGESALALHNRLLDVHQVQVPVFEWNGQRLLRVALHLHTDLADVEALVVALQREGLAETG